MSVFLDRVDSAPLQGNDFSFDFNTWLAVTIDTLNETIALIETQINQTSAPSYTTAQITTLAATSPNGTLWYDTDTNQLKAKVNGVVVVIV